MKHLSRFDIECIGKRIIRAYCKQGGIAPTECQRINPELLITELLKLKVGYEHLSLNGDILGLTTFQETGVEVYNWADEPIIYCLDGKTILVEKELKNDVSLKGRCNFTMMHEAAHQVFKMLFPNEYGVSMRERSPLYFYMENSATRKPIYDWEEWQANALASAILLPEETVKKGMFMFNLGNKIDILSKDYRPNEYDRFCALADFLGASKQALKIRMKFLKLLDKDFTNTSFDILDFFGGDEIDKKQ